jgi:hypothetical protein
VFSLFHFPTPVFCFVFVPQVCTPRAALRRPLVDQASAVRPGPRRRPHSGDWVVTPADGQAGASPRWRQRRPGLVDPRPGLREALVDGPMGVTCCYPQGPRGGHLSSWQVSTETKRSARSRALRFVLVHIHVCSPTPLNPI